MKITSLFPMFVLLCNLAFAQVHEISLPKKSGERYTVSKNDDGLRFTFNHEKLYSKVKKAKDASSYTDIWLKGSYPNGEVGTPKLPAYKKLIRIPKGSKPKVNVVSYSEQLISLAENGISLPIYPNQASVQKDQDSSKVKFEVRKSCYAKNSFSNAPIATIEVLGNLRSATIARLVINPIDYNPGGGLVKVYNDIDVEVSFGNPTGIDNEQEYTAKTYSPYFDNIYKSLEGSSKSSYTDHPDLTKYPVKMLIISNRMFEATLQPFVQWKSFKGFNVKVLYTDEIGTTAELIKTSIRDEYNSATPESPAPSFLLIVGDVEQVVASDTGSQSKRLTDLYYASIDGDMFPDMYYGRLSAISTAQLENIIGKILYYEKYQFADPSYLNSVTLIAGADVNWNSKVGQPTIKYGTANYFNSSHGFNAINEYGVASDPNNSNANAYYSGCYNYDKISVGFINYTAHGSETSWADPYLGISDVSNFTNTNKYPLAIGNCCFSGDFGYSECVGESWIRAQNKGAVTYIGSSPSTYWFEDFYWAVGAFPMVGENNGYVPTFQETTIGAYDAPFVSNYITTGAMVFAGNLSVTEVNVQGYPSQSSPTYYWEAYNILGDPSLMPYFTEAEANQISHDQVISLGVDTFSVNALANSYIAISKDNQLVGVSFASITGNVNVPITPLTTTGDVVIVVTRPQTIPYIDTITAISPTGPYLLLNSFSINDQLSNNNGKADYNESFSIKAKIKNVGIEDATNVKVKLLGADDNITIESNDSISVSNISHIEGNNVLTIDNAFSFRVKENIPDQHTAAFTLKFYSDQGSWSSTLKILLNSPVLTLDELKLDDSLSGGNNDGFLNQGEMCKAFVNVLNKGHALAKDITFLVSIPDSVKTILSVNNIQTEPFSLEANSFFTLPFRISVNPNIHQEPLIPIILQASVAEPSGQSQTFEKRIEIISNDNVTISNDTLNTCFTNFYDSGGKNASYRNYENYTITFVAQNEYSLLRVIFKEFSTENGYDYLYVYDGSNTNYPQVSGSPFSGTTLPSEIISSSRCLTFMFKSDVSNISDGWTATIGCIDPQIPACATEPNPADGGLAVQLKTLHWASQKYATFYDVYLGFSPTELALAGRVEKPEFTFDPEKSKTYYWQIIPGNYLGLNSSSCNTWHFTTDTISSIVMSTNTLAVDTMLFYDSGGPLLNYMNNENYTLTFKPKYTGSLINVDFKAFSIENSCTYDRLIVYNGLRISSPILGTYCGVNSPGVIQASNVDGALTFQFQSNAYTTESGWQAIVKSIGSAVFKTISINVQNSSTPLPNASVNIGGEIKTTDSNGNVSFTVVVGDVDLTVHALGYKTLNRIVLESETNSTIIVNLEKLHAVNIQTFDKRSLHSIAGVKIKVENDSTFTNSTGQARFNLTQGAYTIYFDLKGYLPYSKQFIVAENDTSLDVLLSGIKYRVSIIVSDILGNRIEGAQVSAGDTTLTTNVEGLALGSFTIGNYPITISKSLYIPLSTWFWVNDSITKRAYLDASPSLYNIEFTFVGQGPKNTTLISYNDIDLFYNSIHYSRFKTNAQGKGNILLPQGDFYYNIAREGYYSISNKHFSIDSLINQITDTLFLQTFSVQFNVKSQSDEAIQNATVTLDGYSPITTNSLGEASFIGIGYEKLLPFTVQRNGFINASGVIDVIEPIVLDINLNPNGTPAITSKKVKVFPNPTSGQLSIESDHPITRVVAINTLGVVVSSNDYPFMNHVNLYFENQSPGVYFLVIYTDSLITEKVMIVKK